MSFIEDINQAKKRNDEIIDFDELNEELLAIAVEQKNTKAP